MLTNDPQKNLAAALGRLPSGIFIVTACRPGCETGMLASWVQQCSFHPPMLSFAVQRGRPITELLLPGAPFTVNILEAAQTDMIAHFGKGFALQDDAFTDLDIERNPPHGPVLKEAHAYLYVKVADQVTAGDHQLYLAEVTAGWLLDDGQPMVHIRKNGFHY